MGPAHYVEARQFFFPKTTLAVKGINHILEEKNCQKGDVGYFSEGAAENSSEVGNPIVLDIGPPQLCPTELRRSFSYTRYLYLYLKQAQVFIFVFEIYTNLHFAICHFSTKTGYSIKKHLVWTSLTRDGCRLEFDVVNLTSKEVGKNS